jgi:hypothetical protein
MASREALAKFGGAKAFCLGLVAEERHLYDLIPKLNLKEKCKYCEAILWKKEFTNRNTPCCNNGEIRMKNINWHDMYESQVAQRQYDAGRNDNDVVVRPTAGVDASLCSHAQFKQDVKALKRLFEDPKFWDASRKINLLFSFTSVGAKEVPLSQGPPAYKIQGQMVHNLGSYRPKDANPPNFAQVYVLDGTDQTDLRTARGNEMAFADEHQEFVKWIQTFMSRHNHFSRVYA